MSLNITGSGEASIPPGATIEATSWHVAGHYGPGPEHPTEADAIHAAIERYYQNKDAYDAHQGAGATIWPYEGRVPSVDLRWKMGWEQGLPDANGHRVIATGIEQTVRRVTYVSIEEAEAHLRRIMDSFKINHAYRREFEEHRWAWASENPEERVLCAHDLTERCHPAAVIA